MTPSDRRHPQFSRQGVMNMLKPRRVIFLLLLCCVATCGVAQGVAPRYAHSVTLTHYSEGNGQKQYFVPESLPLPGYPAEMLRAFIDGSVSVSFFVKPDGTVVYPTITKSTNDAFARAVEVAVKQWKFRPIARRSGDVPIACRIVFKMLEE